jgi:hypothetical protein
VEFGSEFGYLNKASMSDVGGGMGPVWTRETTWELFGGADVQTAPALASLNFIEACLVSKIL